MTEAFLEPIRPGEIKYCSLNARLRVRQIVGYFASRHALISDLVVDRFELFLFALGIDASDDDRFDCGSSSGRTGLHPLIIAVELFGEKFIGRLGQQHLLAILFPHSLEGGDRLIRADLLKPAAVPMQLGHQFPISRTPRILRFTPR